MIVKEMKEERFICYDGEAPRIPIAQTSNWRGILCPVSLSKRSEKALFGKECEKLQRAWNCTSLRN